MRDNCRERNSGADRQRRFKDFRENLVLIFVDNLNLQVDQAFLWSLFKVFGRVRDIYLSTATERRNIGYVFVRFGTIEEARRVADKTNGMHVFGWLIRAKVAQNGWKSRRMVNEGGFTRNSKFMNEDKIACKEGSFEKGQGGSYADVVKVNTDEKGITEEIYAKTVELVVTESVISNGLSFQNSVVGVMRNFGNITRVKKRLWNRGFSFTTKFLGGKAILWSFESIQECEGFIRNNFFWKDLFLSMEKWSVVRSFDQKPVWFNFTGVALDYWNEVFFKTLSSKFGSNFGELALVEEGTRLRKRLDLARLLLLVSLAKFLGLKDEINGGSHSNEEGSQFQNQKETGKGHIEEETSPSSYEFSNEGHPFFTGISRGECSRKVLSVNWTTGDGPEGVRSQGPTKVRVDSYGMGLIEKSPGQFLEESLDLALAQLEDGFTTPPISPLGRKVSGGNNADSGKQVQDFISEGRLIDQSSEALIELALIEETRRVEKANEENQVQKVKDFSKRQRMNTRGSIFGFKNKIREETDKSV
ncbi:hypothetical protein Ddye_026869 [Dipteronia dyeriana]|uniref:RRM domain-containing protein n=1 Tax=Dipteronia dyeriana TaxID=168575 RepID=A0AAD9WPN5_9ROSI|nr:hypothetical protein Ddye_026869 [Dipteronia dyeriana]